MFSLKDPQFWFDFIMYLVAVFFAYYIPGSVLLTRYKLSLLIHVPLSIALGMVLLAYQGIMFGYLHVRYLSYIYLLLFLLIWVKQSKHIFNRLNLKNIALPHIPRFDGVVAFILITGVIIQLSTIWFTGMERNGTTVLCCGDPNDNFWFASVTRQIIERIPPYQPGLDGIEIKNYHYWSNLIVAETSRIFHLPYFETLFQYGSILISFLCGLLLIGFSRLNKLDNRYTRYILFFFYFGSDIIYWFLFVLGKGFNFSMSSLEDGAGLLANMPRAYAVMIFFASINLFVIWIKNKSVYLTILLALLFASLTGIKIYFGVFIYIGLTVLTTYQFMKEHDAKALFLLILTALLAISIYIPVNSNAGSLYYTAFWRFEDFVVQPALGLQRLELARVVFASAGKWYRVLGYDMLFFMLYIVLIFGTKLLGLIQTPKTLSHFPRGLNVVFISGIIISALLGFFFQQTVGTSNTFNFLVTVFIVLSYYAALTCWRFTQSQNIFYRGIFIALLLLNMLPRIVWKFTRNVYGVFIQNSVTLPEDVLSGMNYIKSNTPRSSLIGVDHKEFPIDKLGPVFSVLSERPMYYSGEGLLQHFQVDVDTMNFRKKTIDTILHSKNLQTVAQTLNASVIDYLVLSPNTLMESTTSAVFFSKAFESKTITIVKVEREKIPQNPEEMSYRLFMKAVLPSQDYQHYFPNVSKGINGF